MTTFCTYPEPNIIDLERGTSLTKDHQSLVKALRELSPSIRESPDLSWKRQPALRIIDCVLSLNRNYDRFVVPRLDSFEKNHPSVRTVSELHSKINTYKSPDDFVRRCLNYKDEARADTLAQLVCWLLTISESEDPSTQLKKLKSWAINADYKIYTPEKIKGFGLAGFQYLRMLFGANTTKPDIRICKWVSDVVGHKVSPRQALDLLECAAATAEISLRDADTTIWNKLSRGSQGRREL